MTERSLPIVNCQLVSHCRLLIANCRLVHLHKPPFFLRLFVSRQLAIGNRQLAMFGAVAER